MERLTQSWKFSILVSAIAVLLGTNAKPLYAQSTTAPLGNNPADQELNDVFNNRDQSASSLFSLINRIQLLNGRSAGDFAADQDENFQSAVNDFRKKQQQREVPAQTPLSSPSSPAPLP